MKFISTYFAAVVPFFLVGCLSVNIQVPEVISSREPILFEAYARMGQILNTGNRISWEYTDPIFITDSTLYCKSTQFSLVLMESVTVGSFHDVGSGPLQPPKTYNDLLIIKPVRTPYLLYGEGIVFQLWDEKTTNFLRNKSPNQRLLAERAASIINTHKASLDPFGRNNGSREIWVSPNMSKVYPFWKREPHHLEIRFPSARTTLDIFFEKARGHTSERFRKSFMENLRSPTDGKPRYSFRQFPDHVKIRRDWIEHSKKEVKRLQPSLDSVLETGISVFWFMEEIDPSGQISIQVTFRVYQDFYDADPPKRGISRYSDKAVTLPLQEWLDGGTERILQEVDRIAFESAKELSEELASHANGFWKK